MKLQELATELSDPTPEQMDYEVVARDEGGKGNVDYDVIDVKWEHDETRVVISFV